jgi:hypothetical protein
MSFLSREADYDRSISDSGASRRDLAAKPAPGYQTLHTANARQICAPTSLDRATQRRGTGEAHPAMRFWCYVMATLERAQ